LHDELGVRIPAYVLFTKVDLLSGFVEFFDGLGKEEREQVWGTTFPLDDGRDEAGTVALFAPEFDKLLDRLNDRMLERVQQEPDLQRRRLVYGFPQQLASLRGTVAEFLTEIFRPSRLEARPLLRGVYFTSGTQDGTPIDRLLGAMAGQFGLQRQAVAAFSGAGRSYFLARLMREVLFGEAGLVSRDPKVERRQRLVQIGAYSIAGLILIGLTGAWTASYLGNRAMIGDVHAAGAQYDAQYAALAKRGPQDTDLAALLPALATLRTMPGGYDDREKSTPLELTFGLYQGQKLSVAANDTYGRALNALLLPRLLARLETLMQTHRDKPDFLYETLKVYLILGRQGPLDRDLVEQWVGSDIAANYAGDDKTEQREALLAHLHALLQYPLASVPLNGPLVAQARAVLTRQPLADYIYNRLLRSAVVQSLPEWTIADNAGPAGARVFELRDGKPLNTGMPGIFTWNGYHTAFLPLLPAVTKDATEDAWVLGRQQKAGLVGSVAGMNQLRRDVLGLYLDDYTRRWDALLVDIALKPFATIAQGLDELYLLSAPESPLRDLLQAANAQTQLSRPAAVEQAAGQAEAKVAKVGQKLTGFGTYLARSGMTFEQLQVGSIVAEAFGSDPAGKPIDPATRVDEHFKGFNDFVSGGKDKPGDLEAVIVKIQQIYQGLNQAANAANPGQVLLGNLATGGGAGGGGSPAAQLADIAQAPGVPKPVAAMLQTVSQSSSQVTANGASQQLADAWGSKVVPLCRDAFNRYPFIDSAQDVPLDDFTHLLGPGGLMDQFFEQYLKSFVDTSQEPWRWQSGDHTKLGVSPTSLPEFQRAADIRDALFPAGGSKVLVKFHLEPIGMDPGLSQISIEIGTDERMAYAQGPKQDTAMLWPANDGATQIRVTMTPSGGGEGVVNTYEGPWALLRMLQAAQPTQTGALDVVDVTFASPAGKAYFKLTAGSVHNPFTLPALRTFRCPPKL